MGVLLHDLGEEHGTLVDHLLEEDHLGEVLYPCDHLEEVLS